MILMSMLRAAILAASVQASPVCCDCCSGIDCCAGGSCCDAAACCDVAACCKACSGDGCDQCCDQAADCCNAADACDAATKAAAKEAVTSCCTK